MNGFTLWALLLPAVVGLFIPAILAGPDLRVGINRCLQLLAACGTISLALRLPYDAPEWATLKTILFAASFAMLVAGITLVIPDRTIGQILACLCAVLMMGTLFAAPRTVDPTLPLDTIHRNIRLLLAANPYAVMAGSILEIDILRQRSIYSELADYHAGDYPVWWHVAAAYAGLGAALAALGYLIRRLPFVTARPPVQ